MCSNCGKTGHIAAKCYLKDKKDVRVNKLGSEAQGIPTKIQGWRKGDIRCYNCGEVSHMARDIKHLDIPKEISSCLKRELKADRRIELTPVFGQ